MKASIALRKEFRREAVESNIMNRSEQQAIELMNTMFSPIVKSINNRYELKSGVPARSCSRNRLCGPKPGWLDLYLYRRHDDKTVFPAGRQYAGGYHCKIR